MRRAVLPVANDGKDRAARGLEHALFDFVLVKFYRWLVHGIFHYQANGYRYYDDGIRQ
jgi:hypothetical protein